MDDITAGLQPLLRQFCEDAFFVRILLVTSPT